MRKIKPAARFKDIVVQELRDEVLIANLTDNRAFCLNRTASEVWKLCDGTRDPKQIAKELSTSFHATVNEELVWFALEELSKENLLVEKIPSEKLFDGMSRREIIRRVGLASIIALPSIASIVMPTAASAASQVCPVGTACRCLYSTMPTQTSCPNTDPLGCARPGCICNYGNPTFACSFVAASSQYVCHGVCA